MTGIPTMKEWFSRIMSELNFGAKERKGRSEQQHVARRFNYASNECGAKVLGANPEATVCFLFYQL